MDDPRYAGVHTQNRFALGNPYIFATLNEHTRYRPVSPAFFLAIWQLGLCRGLGNTSGCSEPCQGDREFFSAPLQDQRRMNAKTRPE